MGRIKVVEDPIFKISGSPLKKMRKICFINIQAERPEIDSYTAVQRIEKAPLKY